MRNIGFSTFYWRFVSKPINCGTNTHTHTLCISNHTLHFISWIRTPGFRVTTASAAFPVECFTQSRDVRLFSASVFLSRHCQSHTTIIT